MLQEQRIKVASKSNSDAAVSDQNKCRTAKGRPWRHLSIVCANVKYIVTSELLIDNFQSDGSDMSL